MKYDSDRHHRRSIRLQGYDYTSVGAYFVTICARDKACFFGDVMDGEMRINNVGRIIEECWSAIPEHFPGIELDEFIIMPNHIHGIIVIIQPDDIIVGAPVGARHAVPLQQQKHRSTVGVQHAVPQQWHTAPRQRTEQFGKPVSGSLPTIIRSFKSASTKRINESRATSGAAVWQRNYYEHIIRNEKSLNRIREYIARNPRQWEFDHYNPFRLGHDIS